MDKEDIKKLGKEIISIIVERTTTEDGKMITAMLFSIMKSFFMARLDEGEDKVSLSKEYMDQNAYMVKFLMNDPNVIMETFRQRFFEKAFDNEEPDEQSEAIKKLLQTDTTEILKNEELMKKLGIKRKFN